MFRIVNTAGQALELDPSQKISIEKNNPLFNDADKIIQDVSYPGTAPFTPNNAIFFNLAALAESPNSFYNFPIQGIAGEALLIAGNINFRIGLTGYEYNLEPNLVALNALLKGVRMPEIQSEDGRYPADHSVEAIQAYMLATCQHPELYPAIYFPVNNPNLGDADFTDTHNFVNYFDKAAQSFKVGIPDFGSHPLFRWGQSAYFKVGYIIQTIAYYLNFKPEGSFFTAQQWSNVCIYTRRATRQWNTYPSATYMPNIAIVDFLKQIRERMHMAFDFDLARGVLNVETFATILASDPVDLTPYMLQAMEQEKPEEKGYLVTLKTDEQDAGFKVTIGDQDTYPPLFQLKAGDGTTVVELDCSTLKGVDLSAGGVRAERYPATNQTVTGNYLGFGNPPDLTYHDASDPTTLNNWPLRLIKYLGYNEIQPGVFYPEAAPYDLDADDALYYRFLNDSKRFIITLMVPPTVLADLRSTSKYCFRTAGYNYINILMEKVQYDIGINDDLIQVKMYARSLNFDTETVVNISPIVPVEPNSEGVGNTLVKAYFDPAIHGFSQLNLTANGVAIQLISPTNAKGAGGVGAPITNNPEDGLPVTFIITQGQPLYVLHLGVRWPFSLVGGQYQAVVDRTAISENDLCDLYVIFF